MRDREELVCYATPTEGGQDTPTDTTPPTPMWSPERGKSLSGSMPMPAATVPTQIVDAEGQARVLDLPIFVGDTEQEAVDRFLASLGIDKATMTQEQARGGWLWESVRVHGHRDAGAGEGAGSGHHH